LGPFSSFATLELERDGSDLEHLCWRKRGCGGGESTPKHQLSRGPITNQEHCFQAKPALVHHPIPNSI